MKKFFADLVLFIRAWRLAAVKIADDKIARYRPEARHLIVYAQVRKDLVKDGRSLEDLTGSVIHAAIALCYRFH